MNNLVVIGFSKCGCTSLARYLDCQFTEQVYYGPNEFWKENYDGDQPVIVTRDPVERIWSAYNYFGHIKHLTFEQFLDHKSERDIGVGLNDVVRMSIYEPYIELWKDYNPKIYQLEELRQLKDFPRMNQSEHDDIPEEYRRMIESRLKTCAT